MGRAREIADLIGGTTPDIILKTSDGAILNLQTSDTTVTADSVLGAINFQAPDEASGTDSILIASKIEAIAEDTFAADNNATKLVFSTGASAAASERMSISSTGLVTISRSDNAENLSLVSTDADASVGPTLRLDRQSASAADGDLLGKINFVGHNDAGTPEDISYAGITAIINDASDGTEDGKLAINTIVAGTERSRVFIDASETVFNEDSVDVDFRVESNAVASAFFVDAGNDAVVIGESVAHQTISGGTPAFQVSGEGFRGGSAIVRNDNGQFGPFLAFAKSRNSTPGSFTIVQSGDGCGGINFFADDGTNLDSQVATIVAEIDSTPGENDTPGRIEFSTTADGAAAVSERMRITASGKVGIGISAPNAGSGGGLHLDLPGNGSESGAHLRIGSNVGYSGFHFLDGTAYFIGQNSSARELRLYSGAETAGATLTNGATSFGTFSDERLKYDVEDIENAIDMIRDWRTVKYRLDGVDEPNSKKKIGIVAQDLVGVLDEVIESTKRKGDETKYMTVRYTEIVPVLVKALQETTKRIETLEAEVKTLKGQ